MRISNIEYIDREQQVHDFTVENNHNFWVKHPESNHYFLSSNCHRISMAGANALLKPLEEPPAHTLWILATTDPEKIPNHKAVLGRCTQLILVPPTKEEIGKRLRTIAKKEKIDWLDKSSSLAIGEASGGHVRDAVQIFESVARHIKGLDKVPKKKKLASLIQDLAVKNIDQNVDKIVMSLLAGIYLKEPKRVQKAILDVEDFTSVMNKLLYLNYYLVNKILVGKHEKVWETVVNKALYNFLKDNDAIPDEDTVTYVHQELTKLKEKMSAYLVGGEHLFTSYLTQLAIQQEED